MLLSCSPEQSYFRWEFESGGSGKGAGLPHPEPYPYSLAVEFTISSSGSTPVSFEALCHMTCVSSIVSGITMSVWGQTPGSGLGTEVRYLGKSYLASNVASAS